MKTAVLLLSGLLAAQEPLLVYDVTFSDQQAGQPVQPLDWDGWAAAETGDQALPLCRPSAVRCVTPTRTATVVEQAAGMAQPALLAWADGEQPHYGPMLVFDAPRRLQHPDHSWRLSLDVAKTTTAISGGVHAHPVFLLEWFEDGTVRANGIEVARYAANRTQRMEVAVDGVAKTFVIAADGGQGRPLPWLQPKGRFSGLRLHGLLPGGHNEAPSAMVYDNIRIALLSAPAEAKLR